LGFKVSIKIVETIVIITIHGDGNRKLIKYKKLDKKNVDLYCYTNRIIREKQKLLIKIDKSNRKKNTKHTPIIDWYIISNKYI
jgi:hypothetical protein